MVVKEELNMGVTTSLVPVIQARRNEYPRSRYAQIEENETDYDRNHHAKSDNQRRFYIPQKQDRYQADKEKT